MQSAQLRAIWRGSSFFIAANLLFMLSSACAQTNVADKIRQVENGLLPAVVVEGEQTEVLSIAERMKHHKVPGLSIAVIKDGRIEWAKGYGVANQENSKPVDENTMFQAASISKPVAALASLHWVEKGKLSLDNNINAYLKDWQVPDNKFTVTEKVTLRRLITHTAGLTVHGFRGYAKGEEVPTVIQLLNGEKPANSKTILPDTLPGKIWRYSGGGYTVMQKALADQVGKPFPVIMQETVLSKLGMVHSSYEQPLAEKFTAFAATGYRSNGKAVKGEWHTYPEMAAAGLWTTPSDLARYIIEVQESLQGKSNKVISKYMTEQMLTKHLDRWGLGPGLDKSGNALVFNHGGANEGFRCVFMAQAYSGNGVVIMTNSDNGSAVAAEILRGISKIYGWDFGKPTQVKKFDLTDEQAGKLPGKYRMQNYTFELTQTNGKLYAKPQWEDEIIEIIPENTTKFLTRDGQFWLEFQYEGDSKVKAVKLNGREVFEKIE